MKVLANLALIAIGATVASAAITLAYMAGAIQGSNMDLVNCLNDIDRKYIDPVEDVVDCDWETVDE